MGGYNFFLAPIVRGGALKSAGGILIVDDWRRFCVAGSKLIVIISSRKDQR
jgi:hypothetical protein